MGKGIWTGVRERVLALAEAPGADAVFGAGGHSFALDDRLAPEELDSVEAWVGIRLPAEYRTFLLEVGAGGAGPYYGVYPLERGTEGAWRWRGRGAEMTVPTRLTEPFPRSHPHAQAVAALAAEEPRPENFTDRDGFGRASSSWELRMEDLSYDEDRTTGALCLCHLDCGMYHWLIVSGPESGRIWYDGRADGMDMVALTGNDGEPVTFGRWYLEWLEQTTARAAAA